jgi:phenylpropionate dioxygenase-like ring-hydroxylating dioxygenase large terminal subunit
MVEVAARGTVCHAPSPAGTGPITAERYVSEGWLAREFAELWPRLWQFACLERDVAEPGQYVVWNIGRESVIVSRGHDGALAANFNACQHRGARILVDDRGCAKQFTCPYHGWSYRPDGRLVVVPDNQRFPNGIDRKERSLKPVRVAAALGLVFVCMDPDSPPLDEYLAPLVARLTPYGLPDMTLVADQTVLLNCNWKAVLDNFHELYHVEHIHPLHALHFDCPTSFVELFEHGHTCVAIHGHAVNTRLPIPDDVPPVLHAALARFGADPDDYRGRVLDVRKDIQKLRRDAGPRLGLDYDGFSDDRLSDVEQYNAMPNLMITVQPDDALVMRARPHETDPNWCYWDKFTFHRRPDAAVARRHGVTFKATEPTRADPAPRPEHDEFGQDDIIEGRKTMGVTIDQDVHFIRDVQAGMHSRGFGTQILNSDEVRIQHFHDWYGHWMTPAR